MGEGGAGVMVFTDEGYFLFLPGSRVIFAVILFLTNNNQNLLILRLTPNVWPFYGYRLAP